MLDMYIYIYFFFVCEERWTKHQQVLQKVCTKRGRFRAACIKNVRAAVVLG